MILLIIISILTILPLAAPGYFPMHDDLQVMRLWQMEKCFADGQIPCRWAPDMTLGYGQAMFNFYSVSPYYLGILIRLLTPLTILGTAKLLFAISLITGSIGMFYLAKEIFGRRGALVPSILYALAPYRSINVYVRGALSEAVSLSILPFLWLFIYQTIKKPTYKNSALMAITFALLLSTHNISTMMYSLFTFVWTAFWLVRNLNRKTLLHLAVGGFLGIGLAGFFIIPVFLETSLIKGEVFTSNYSYFVGHFVTLKQLFISRFWGYGGSIFGENDGMAFQVGWPHWWVAIAVGILSLRQALVKKEKTAILTLGLLAMAGASLLMTHNKSTFVWTSINAVSFIQFPWRFLGIALFLICLSAGAFTFIKKKLIRGFISLVIIILAIVLNLNYFRPEKTYDWLTDEIKLSGDDLRVQQGAAALDYLPKTVIWPPLDFAFSVPEVVEGDATIPNFTETSSTFFFDAEVREDATLDLPIIYFPNWEAYIMTGAGIPIPVYPSEIEGLVRVEVPKGKHMVFGRFVNTRARQVGNAITVASFIILASGFIITSSKKTRVT